MLPPGWAGRTPGISPGMPTSVRGLRRPRYPGTALEVSQLDINTSEARLVYSDPDCEALILQCNISDIFPDAEIRLRCEEGEAEFSPYISLRDGSVVLGPEGLDLTRE